MSSAFAIAQIVIKELYRRKDFYVLFVLSAAIILVSGAQSFFGDKAMARYLKEISLVLIWVSTLVIAIVTTARQIPSERENRTIFPLLAKPVSRGAVMLGKFLGCWAATGLTLMIFYLFFAVIVSLREGHLPFWNYAEAIWLQWVMLGIVIAFTLFGSLVFAAPSSNATIVLIVTFSILWLGRHLNKVALQLEEPIRSIVYGLYFLIPHLEFFDVRELLIHNWPSVALWVVAVATLYGFAYTLFFLMAAWLIFRRKALN